MFKGRSCLTQAVMSFIRSSQRKAWVNHELLCSHCEVVFDSVLAHSGHVREQAGMAVYTPPHSLLTPTTTSHVCMYI